MKNKHEIAKGLWAEYLRVEEWAVTDDEIHSARVAIRCVATRLDCYNEFVACGKPKTLRSLGAVIGSKVRFIDDPEGTTRTVQSDQQLDYPHMLPWILVQK